MVVNKVCIEPQEWSGRPMATSLANGKKPECNICSCTRVRPIVSANQWAVYACSACGFKFAVPSESDLLDVPEHYDAEYFRPLRNRDSMRRWKQTYEDRLNFARKHAPGKRVLDAGAGASGFPIIAKEQGFDTSVLDGSPWAVSFLQDNFSINGQTCDLNNFSLEPGCFDFIHSSHVIEHLIRPRQFLEQLYGGLDHGGILFLTFPLYGEFITYLRGLLFRCKLANHAYTYDVPDHVSYFTKKTILKTMRGIGFEILSVSTYKYISFLQLVNSINENSQMRKLVKLACRSLRPLTGNVGYHRDIVIYARKPQLSAVPTPFRQPIAA